MSSAAPSSRPPATSPTVRLDVILPAHLAGKPANLDGVAVPDGWEWRSRNIGLQHATVFGALVAFAAIVVVRCYTDAEYTERHPSWWLRKARALAANYELTATGYIVPKVRP